MSTKSLVGIVLLMATACMSVEVWAQDAEKPYLKASEADMQWWKEARFGLFIHWGPVSLKGTEIGWSRDGERRGQKAGRGQIPVAVYDNLYKEFNPVKFNADEWVAMAQDAGMKYLVFTSKHHDGFSMFDSKLTEYKITNSPFKRDVVKELADACHKAGLHVGFYYSPPDWHHPDYRTENHAKYIEYMHGQLREICTNYGKIDIIWFDGLGGTAADWDSKRLFKMIRELQPGVIINNRAGLPADHDTPEQTIGRFQYDRPWESCITICQQWAWKPDDKMKSLEECLHTLVRCAGGDGNLLFNVGPMPTGEIEPRQVERLKEMGAWLRQYGESIYATRGGPYQPGPWGASTRKDNRIYLHVLDWPKEGLVLPPLPKKIVAASLLTGGTVTVAQGEEGVRVDVVESDRQPIDTIVALDLESPAAEIPPIKWPSGSVSEGKTGAASNIYQNMPEYNAAKAFDGEEGTRWATDGGTRAAWLEVDLGAPVTFSRAVIKEAFDRVRSFQLQQKVGEKWEPFARGTVLGEQREIKFSPVTAQHVRLEILNATDGPTLWEFQLFK